MCICTVFASISLLGPLSSAKVRYSFSCRADMKLTAGILRRLRQLRAARDGATLGSLPPSPLRLKAGRSQVEDGRFGIVSGPRASQCVAKRTSQHGHYRALRSVTRPQEDLFKCSSVAISSQQPGPNPRLRLAGLLIVSLPLTLRVFAGPAPNCVLKPQSCRV